MKVLIIEDNKEIVETISLLMRMAWPDCKIASEFTGKQGLELAASENPDIVLLDLGLPDISGFDVLKEIRTFSKMPIIIVTVRNEQSEIVRGLNLGADDYLIKPFGQLELLARVKALLRRTQDEVEDKPVTVGKMHFGPSLSKLLYDGREIPLTNMEGLILYQLMKNSGNVLSYTTLAERIWGDYYPGVVNNIRVYVRRLRGKLETDPDHPKIILTKVGVGYFLQEPT